VNHGFIDDVEALIISLTTNENQKRLSIKERFEGYRRLKAAGLPNAKIAEVMAVDRRTVDEALRIQSKGSKALKKAAVKSTKEGGVATRVASRAASLPKIEQKKILPKVKGKPQKEAMLEVRKVEKRIGIKKPGPDAKAPLTSVPKLGVSGYKVAEDVAERCEKIEKILKKKLRYSREHRVLNGQMMVIEVIKGKMDVTDLFEWDGIN